ncbi:transposase [Paraphaeosphaeria sporulosa]
MDREAQILAQGLPPGVPPSYRALADHGNAARSTLHARAHGRPSMKKKAQSQQYLHPWEEDALVKFLLQMSDLGQPVRIKFIPYLAFCIARQRPNEDRPSKPPSKNWPRAYEERHPQTQARRVRALDWDRHEKNTYWKMVHWFEVIGRVLSDPAILAENVYNMDETGIMLSMLGAVKVLVGKNDTRDYRGARVKRKMVTSIECISADDSYISLQWLQRIFDPETKERANNKPRVLICDGFGTHESLEILEFCFANIILCRLPSHTSHKLQPCDVAVFAPLKAAYREQVERLERGGVNTIGKQHFTSLFSPARQKALTAKNIKAGFAATGLFPFNPDRVLNSVPKPVEEASTITAERAVVQTSPTDENPQTPVTPVSLEGLTLLRNLILKQDAHTLDDKNKSKLEKHLNLFAEAAQSSFAKNALQQNHIRLLLKVNDEAKVRRSTKSLVLGTATVMGFQELQIKRAKRAEDAAAAAAKAAKVAEVARKAEATKAQGKQGRKRTRATADTEVVKPRKRVARARKTTELAISTTAHVDMATVVESEPALSPWKATVARMY